MLYRFLWSLSLVRIGFGCCRVPVPSSKNPKISFHENYKNLQEFWYYKNSQKYEFSQIFGSDHVLEPCMELVFQRFLEKSLERIFLLAKNTALAKIYQNYKNSCNFSAGLTRDNPTPKISCEIQSRHPIQGSCAI